MPLLDLASGESVWHGLTCMIIPYTSDRSKA